MKEPRRVHGLALEEGKHELLANVLSYRRDPVGLTGRGFIDVFVELFPKVRDRKIRAQGRRLLQNGQVPKVWSKLFK